MVEFIIVLPICLILLMATAEFGRAFMQYNTLTKAVRDGARFLASNSLQGSTGTVSISGQAQAATQNLVVYGNATGAGSPVLPGLTTADVTVANAGGGNVSVSAVYPYGSIFAFVPGFFYGGDVDTTTYSLQTAVTMRAL
jgi:Flp pilus assembly protein TadG